MMEKSYVSSAVAASSRRVFTAALAVFALVVATADADEQRPPNILVIYADDLGYGDVGCYNSESKVATPNLDRLAAEGMRFTDAHSPSTVCTPSRYGILTGHMPFRIGYKGVFVGVQGPCLIPAERLTLPQLLKDHGYATALFGKWHLGMTFRNRAGQPVFEASNARDVELVREVDFSKPIDDGPLHRGFDHFFGTACCPTTDWLYAFIDGDRVPNTPGEVRDRASLPDHPWSFDCRPGDVADDFVFDEVDLVFLQKSQQFLKEHVATTPDKPFFLFHSAQAVHLPSFPAKRFHGQSKAGPHGDFIFEFDWIVGQLMATLEELNVANDTLVIVTSDNGPEVGTVINMRAQFEHDGANPWRGMKRDQWEGGHRVPFIARWPGHVPASSTSDETMCQTDLLATCASIINADLPANAAEDSFDMTPVFLGQNYDGPIRPYILHQTMSLGLAIRRGSWKYLDHKGSAGNNYAAERLQKYAIDHGDTDAPGQLYDLATDPGETKNLYSQRPEVVAELKNLLDETIRSGRSRP